jgi:hypothetical protein
MIIKLVNKEKQWNEIYESMPEFIGKIYYSFNYFEALRANNEGTPSAVYFKTENGFIFYPFLIKDVPNLLAQGYADIESPYGYGGPVIIGCDYKDIRQYIQEYFNLMREQRVIAEFVRFSPFLPINEALKETYELSLNRKTVCIELNDSFAEVIKGCTGARKRNYKRACRNLYLETNYEINQAKNIFKNLYTKNMNRLEADNYYYFSDNYFDKLLELPAENISLNIVCTYDRTPVAAGIFLKDSVSVHYHLGASDLTYKEMQPASFLILNTAKEAIGEGKKAFHLGGGVSKDCDDKLFRFKRGFSEQVLNFYIGKKIYDIDKYNLISKNWQKITGKIPEIHLHYHYL